MKIYTVLINDIELCTTDNPRQVIADAKKEWKADFIDAIVSGGVVNIQIKS